MRPQRVNISPRLKAKNVSEDDSDKGWNFKNSVHRKNSGDSCYIYLGWIPWIFKILIRGFLSSKSTILVEIMKIIARVIFSNSTFLWFSKFWGSQKNSWFLTLWFSWFFSQIEISKIQNTQNFHGPSRLNQWFQIKPRKLKSSGLEFGQGLFWATITFDWGPINT